MQCQTLLTRVHCQDTIVGCCEQRPTEEVPEWVARGPQAQELGRLQEPGRRGEVYACWAFFVERGGGRAMRQSRQGPSIQWVVFWAVGLLGSPLVGQYGGGAGVENDPYQISDVSHLIRMSGNLQDLDAYFELTEPLDLGGIEFSPIGQSLGGSFRGVFDGNNYEIRNIRIRGNLDDTGFFGFAAEKNSNQQAVIKNLKLINVDIKGNDAVGGLVGNANGVNITNCHVSGKVEGNAFTGGLVGHCEKGEIIDSSCSASVTGGTGAQYVGGFVGANGRSGIGWGANIFQCSSTGTVQAGTASGLIGGFVGYSRSVEPISQCFASGNVAGGSKVGGFIGELGQSFEDYGIENCYSRGAVSGHVVGGFVGYFGYGAIRNCYSTGFVTATGESAYGGFDGSMEGEQTTVSNCFWDIDTSGQTQSVSGRGYHTPQMQQQDTFNGWDFVGETANGTDDIWTIQEGVTYPYFGWHTDPNNGAQPDPADLVVSIVGDTNIELFLEDAFEITLMLRNIGETDAVPNAQSHFDTILYLSGDRNPDWNQLDAVTYGVGQVQLDQLQAGDEHLVSVPLLASSEPGIWYLRAKIDDSDEVMEGDEQNNWTSSVALAVKRLLKADITGDGLVDLEDLLVLCEHWLTDNEVADIYPYPQGDGIVDLGDFSALASEWNLTDGVSSDRVPLSTGTFEMGDHFNEGYSREVPVHAVTVSPLHVSRHLITNTQYCEFLNSALSTGSIAVVDGVVHSVDSWMNYPYCDTVSACSNSQITFDGSEFSVQTKGGRDMSDDPVVQVSWYGAAAYCNWRSKQAGRQPCYHPYTWTCDFSKNGYHLPTEAQWEYAARGGLIGRRFPWGDTISELDANYYSDISCSYDMSLVSGFNPLFRDWLLPYTSPVRSFPPNGYGLYDMAGNVREWCHDWYAAYGSAPKTDPRGPQTGTHRIIRGGCWGSPAVFCRVAYRGGYLPDSRYFVLGFRVAVED
jgi:formylglycine-generating enzyme required for sulfatase activity